MGGQRTASQHQGLPLGNIFDLIPDQPDARVLADHIGDSGGETLAVNSQRRTSGNGHFLGHPKDKRAKMAQLSLQKTAGRCGQV